MADPTGAFRSDNYLDSTGVAHVHSGTPTFKLKPSDEDVNNSITLQNDNDLFFSVAANEKWGFQFALFISDEGTGSGTSGFKFLVALPTGATGWFQYDSSATAAVFHEDITTTTSILAANTSYRTVLLLTGAFLNAGTAGTCQLQWAQISAVAENTRVHAGSWLLASKAA